MSYWSLTRSRYIRKNWWLQEFRSMSHPSDLGGGAGKGGGDGGAVRSAGGGFGKRAAAQEEQFFYNKQKKQLEMLRNILDPEGAIVKNETKDESVKVKAEVTKE